MRIGVIGAGWLGGTVGRLWVRSGHQVLFSSRHPERFANLARELGSRALTGSVADAAAFGPLVLIATPYAALPTIGRDHHKALQGKIVLDATNPSPSDPLGRDAGLDGVGQISARLLPGSRLVRVFGAVDASAIEASAAGRGEPLAVPLAGDDPEAVETAILLVRDAGCEALLVGDLASARSFQRHGPGFRANTGLTRLRRLLGPEKDSEEPSNLAP
jgi:8-hydroxy-5-deazaflavin:NADPH oxidoreductase